MSFFYWIDIIWLPIVYYGVPKRHRWLSVAFILTSIILIRLITETMVYIGYEFGIMGFLSWHVHTRGLVITSLFYVIFLFFAHFSKKTEGIVFFAACLSIFFLIFLFASLSMLL